MRSKKIKKVFFIFGPPASGKDTQAKLLAKKLRGKRITTSKILRQFFLHKKRKYLILGKRKINLVQERKKYLTGDLVDFHLVAYLIIETIKKQDGIIIFAGSPRSIVEAKAEYNFLKKKKILTKFIYLNIPFEIAFQRAIQRKRKDIPLDDPEIFQKRWLVFEKYTIPAKNFLAKKDIFVEINGEKSVLEVHKSILLSISEVV